MEILDQLNIKTEKEKLYKIALTHTSYANEYKVKSYERLEYLGDAVLELVMSEYLFLKGTEEEGQMTKHRSQYVCENALYEYSKRLGLNQYLLLGHGEEESGGRQRKAIVADIFESFLGAIYLDQGYEFAKAFVHQHVIELIEKGEVELIDDYKSILQERVQTDRRSLHYVVTKEEGPAHDKRFTVEVRIDEIIYGIGTAHSKKEAEQEAAKDALKKCVTQIDE